MSVKIDIAIPGGNVFIEDINGFDIILAKDLRNTACDWFYWAFRAHFDKIGLYHFHFTNGYACGPRGPAVSYDGEATWEWLGGECVSGPKREHFTYYFDGTRGSSVIFCVGMQYQQLHLEAFLERHKESPYLTRSELTRSRKNREVVQLHIEDSSDSSPKKYIFLSSRHHCCEMMATYALEGILESALRDDDLGRMMRKNYVIDAVPFADTDGVLDGDQGKMRRPHDHNRDYNERPLYPEVAAIQKLLGSKEIFFMLDMHCPWLFGGDSETIYFPGPLDKEYERRMQIFSGILEKNSPLETPHFSKNNVLYGTLWNTDKNWTQGLNTAEWGRQQKALFSNSIEIPYANAGEMTFSADSVRRLGRAIAESICEFDRTFRT